MKAEIVRWRLLQAFTEGVTLNQDNYDEAQDELRDIEDAATEYQSPETQRLIEIGRATEKAFEQHAADVTLYEKIGEAYKETMMVDSVEELLEWATQEGKSGEEKE